MANLIEYIQSQVYENSTEDISGSIMQQVLTRMASDEGVVNVHTISGQTPFADYNNAQAARDAVPAGFKKLGLIITYKLSSGWYIDEFIGSATSGWSTASNWKCLGPISVTQNASTGKTTITIGSESFDVATQPVSVSQNSQTGHTEIHIGNNDYPVASLKDLSDIPHPFFAHNYPFITEIYINRKGVAADVYNIHSIGYTNKIVRFSTSQGTWAGETKVIPHIENILAITPRGASDLSVIYGYVIVDWSQISADVDIIEPINESAQILEFSPTIKSYINKGISVAKMSLSDIPDATIIKVLDINGGGNYTDFAVAMDDLIANEHTQPLSQVLLYIKKGTYIVTPNSTQRASGPIVGCSIIAEEGAELVCNYDGADSAKVQSFSPINMYAEVSHKIVIDGLRVTVKNCRYCVHDEMGSLLVDNYTHIFRNCSFTHQTAPNDVWASPRCIGGGLGNGGNILIEDCTFDSKISTSVDYHSGRDGGATGSKIIIQNCSAPKNTVSGTTAQQAIANSSTTMIVSNCLLTQAPLQNNYQGREEVKVLAVGNNVK